MNNFILLIGDLSVELTDITVVCDYTKKNPGEAWSTDTELPLTPEVLKAFNIENPLAIDNSNEIRGTLLIGDRSNSVLITIEEILPEAIKFSMQVIPGRYELSANICDVVTNWILKSPIVNEEIYWTLCDQTRIGEENRPMQFNSYIVASGNGAKVKGYYNGLGDPNTTGTSIYFPSVSVADFLTRVAGYMRYTVDSDLDDELRAGRGKDYYVTLDHIGVGAMRYWDMTWTGGGVEKSSVRWSETGWFSRPLFYRWDQPDANLSGRGCTFVSNVDGIFHFEIFDLFSTGSGTGYMSSVGGYFLRDLTTGTDVIHCVPDANLHPSVPSANVTLHKGHKYQSWFVDYMSGEWWFKATVNFRLDHNLSVTDELEVRDLDLGNHNNDCHTLNANVYGFFSSCNFSVLQFVYDLNKILFGSRLLTSPTLNWGYVVIDEASRSFKLANEGFVDIDGEVTALKYIEKKTYIAGERGSEYVFGDGEETDESEGGSEANEKTKRPADAKFFEVNCWLGKNYNLYKDGVSYSVLLNPQFKAQSGKSPVIYIPWTPPDINSLHDHFELADLPKYEAGTYILTREQPDFADLLYAPIPDILVPMHDRDKDIQIEVDMFDCVNGRRVASNNGAVPPIVHLGGRDYIVTETETDEDATHLELLLWM